MEKLTELKHSVARLSKDEYIKFRQWFWEYENEEWDQEIEKDVKNSKLTALANRALNDFAKGKFTEL